MRNTKFFSTVIVYCLASTSTSTSISFSLLLISPCLLLFLPVIIQATSSVIPIVTASSSSSSSVISSDLTTTKSRRLQYGGGGMVFGGGGVVDVDGGVGEEEEEEEEEDDDKSNNNNNEENEDDESDSSTTTRTRAIQVVEEEDNSNNSVNIVEKEKENENNTILLVTINDEDEDEDGDGEEDGDDNEFNSSNSTIEVLGDGDANDDANDQCSLCQGVTLLKDHRPKYSLEPKYPNVFMTGIPFNATCLEIDNSLRKGQGTTNPKQCRSNAAYNYFFWRCCKASIPRYECEQNVQSHIFDNNNNNNNNNNNYNPAVPPIASKGGDDYNMESESSESESSESESSASTALTVNVQLQYEALETINVEDGTATIFITLILIWNDPRLKWIINQNNTCSSKVTVWASSNELENTKIWVPDYDLFNQIEGVQTWPDVQATIFSDGTVQWIRSGGIEAFCSFTGLSKIPFDTLGCQFLMGSRNRQDQGMINYKSLNDKEITFGPLDNKIVYNEWRAVAERANSGYTFDGEVIYYDFWFQRARTHYIQNVVIPTIILTYTSFLTFLLDLRIGERLGFGMALTLVVVAQQLLTFELIPISNMRLWIDKFVGWSFYWVLLTLLESVGIGFMWYLREDRIARKERKRLSTATAAAAAEVAANDEEVSEEEEASPLTCSKINYPDNDNADENDVEADHKEKETKTKQELSGDNYFMFFFFNYSLRKLDYIMLAFTLSTYTIFIIVMFVTVQGDLWTRGDPKWFDNTTQFGINSYKIDDPNA